MISHLFWIFASVCAAKLAQECHPGAFWDDTSGTCRSCAKGFYNPYWNQTYCMSCGTDNEGRPATTYGTGSINQTQCYYAPSIDSFYPTFGPIGGGTVVKISVAHAARTRATYAMTDTTNWTIVNQTINTTVVTCLSQNVSTVSNTSVKLTFASDQHASSATRLYRYLPNPNVTGVSSMKTFISGGLVIKVYGRYLNSVADPYFLVTRMYLAVPMAFSTACAVISATELHCPTPRLSAALRQKRRITESDDGGLSIMRIKRDGSASGTTPSTLNNLYTQFYAGLQLDGVENYSNLSAVLPGTGQLLVYQDPVYFPFSEVGNVHKFDLNEDEYISIQGEYLNYACTIDDILVTVGNSTCNVTFLATNVLTCKPPSQSPHLDPTDTGPREGLLPRVTVYVGNLIYVIGFLDYGPAILSSSSRNKWLLGVLVAILVVVVILLTVVAVTVWRCRKRRKEQKMYVAETPPVVVRERRYTGRSSAALVYSRMSESSGSSWAPRRESGTTVMSLIVSPPTTPGFNSGGSTEMDLFEFEPQTMVQELDEELMKSLQDILIDNARVGIGQVVGVGYFGKVFKGTLASEANVEHVTVAIKTVQGKHCTMKEVTAFIEEALLMKDFKHPNVLSLIGVVLQQHRPLVILPYMYNGDLRGYIRDPIKKFKVKELLSFGEQIAAGMEYLSQLKFVHRDLATRNCMVDQDIVVKIADFGLSRDVYRNNYYRVENRHRPLPVRWMAVESLTEGVFTAKSDVWSFGVTVWELMTRGCSPYPDVDTFNIKSYVTEGHRLSKPQHCPDQIYALMTSCWHEDHANRPNFEELYTQIRLILGHDDNKDYAATVDTVAENEH